MWSVAAGSWCYFELIHYRSSCAKASLYTGLRHYILCRCFLNGHSICNNRWSRKFSDYNISWLSNLISSESSAEWKCSPLWILAGVFIVRSIIPKQWDMVKRLDDIDSIRRVSWCLSVTQLRYYIQENLIVSSSSSMCIPTKMQSRCRLWFNTFVWSFGKVCRSASRTFWVFRPVYNA